MIEVVALENIMLSWEQSRHDTFRNLADITITSIIDEFEFLSTLAWRIVCFTSFSTTEKDVNSLGRFFATVWFRTWETTVSSHDSAEPSLTPL